MVIDIFLLEIVGKILYLWLPLFTQPAKDQGKNPENIYLCVLSLVQFILYQVPGKGTKCTTALLRAILASFHHLI